MVHCGQAAFTVVFKHREVDNPQRRPFVFVGQAQVFTEFQTQRAQRISYHFLVVSAEENHVAVLCASTIQESFNDVRGQEFRHRAVDTFHAFRTFGHFNVSQAFRAVDLHKVAVFINQLTGQRGAARNAQRGNTAFRIVGRAREDRKLNVFQQIGYIHQLHRVTQVRFIGTVTALSFGESHDRELAQIDAFNVQPQVADQLFHHFTHLRCGHEGGFHVDLGEFWLTVSAQVLVTEAFHNLVVTIETGHHQKLFE